MQKIILSVNSAISWALKILMLAAAGYFFAEGNFLFGIFATLSLGVTLIPAIVNHSFDTNLPWPIDFWLTIWFTFSIAGEAGLYEKFWWWDAALHLAGTAIFAYLAFVLIFALNFSGKIKLSIPLIGLLTFLVAVAFGALWEVAEFWVWQATGHDTLAMFGNIEDGFFDTFSDLQLDILGAAIVSVGGMLYVGHRREVSLREWMAPFVKIFGEKVREKKTAAVKKIKQQKTRLRKKIKRTKK